MHWQSVIFRSFSLPLTAPNSVQCTLYILKSLLIYPISVWKENPLWTCSIARTLFTEGQLVRWVNWLWTCVEGSAVDFTVCSSVANSRKDSGVDPCAESVDAIASKLGWWWTCWSVYWTESISLQTIYSTFWKSLKNHQHSRTVSIELPVAHQLKNATLELLTVQIFEAGPVWGPELSEGPSENPSENPSKNPSERQKSACTSFWLNFVFKF